MQQSQSSERLIAGFSRDGRFAVTQHDNTALVWDLFDGGLVHALSGTAVGWGWMTASFAPGGAHVAIGGRQGTVQVFDLALERQVFTLAADQSGSAGADYSPDGKYLAVTVMGGVILLDARTHERVRFLRSGASITECGAVRFSPDGSRVVANYGASIASLDPEGIAPEVIFRTSSQDLLSLDINPDQQSLIAGCWDCTVRVFDFRTGRLERTLVGHEQRVSAAAFCLGATRILSRAGDGSGKLWDVVAPSDGSPLTENAGWAITLLGNSGVIAGRSGTRVRLVDLESGRDAALQVPEGATSIGAASPDGTKLLCMLGKQGLALWDTAAAAYAWRIDLGYFAIYLRFTPDGRHIISSGGDGDYRLWDAATGSLIRRLPFPDGHRAQSASDPRGAIAAAGYSASVYLGDTSGAEGRFVRFPPEFGTSQVLSVAYNTDGSLLATGDGSGAAIIWDTATWKPVHRVTGMPPGV